MIVEKKKLGKQLSDESLGDVAGGLVCKRGESYYTIVNDKTFKEECVCQYASGAQKEAKKRGYSQEIISYDEYVKRGGFKKDYYC